jgi:GrpB-like predicted nucleotidyltransferase (UPF0157 family)
MTDSGPPPGPMTDEQIRAAAVDEPTRLDGPVHLSEYDPVWPEKYARERQRICAALGPRAVRIEHIGSTSVPGLVAKPIIDILLVVADSSDEGSYVPPLQAVGYVLHIREPNWFQHRLFKGPDTDIHLHVFSEGSEEIERVLRFRDRLRSSAEDRALYAQTKRELARRNWKYAQNYADAKSEVIRDILARAASAPVQR